MAGFTPFLALGELFLRRSLIIRQLIDHAALDLEARQQTEEADIVAVLIRKCVAENTITPKDQEA